MEPLSIKGMNFFPPVTTKSHSCFLTKDQDEFMYKCKVRHPCTECTCLDYQLCSEDFFLAQLLLQPFKTLVILSQLLMSGLVS